MPDFITNLDPTLLAVLAGVAVLVWPQLKTVFSSLGITPKNLGPTSINSTRLQNWEALCKSCKDIQNKQFQETLKTLPGFFIETDLPDEQ